MARKNSALLHSFKNTANENGFIDKHIMLLYNFNRSFSPLIKTGGTYYD